MLLLKSAKESGMQFATAALSNSRGKISNSEIPTCVAEIDPFFALRLTLACRIGATAGALWGERQSVLNHHKFKF